MPLLFSDAGLERFREIVKPGLLCAFDFDGTLAPIVREPEKARLPSELMRRLVRLSACAPVAIITGRSVADVRSRLGFMPDFIIGNHGVEGLPGWEARAENYRRFCRAWRESLMARIEEIPDPGIFIEDKNYSLSLHYRLARDPAKTEALLRQLFAGLEPLPRVVAGKFVFNLVPQDADDKGSALEQLMRQSGAHSAIYVGDDVTDEDVFRLRRDDLLSVRIGHAPDSAAQFHLDHRQAMADLLDELISRLRALEAKNWVQLEHSASQRA